MQKKRRNPPAWYSFSDLTNNKQHTIPMNRAARRALKKLTGDIGLMPPILLPLTKEERLARIKAKEATSGQSDDSQTQETPVHTGLHKKDL